MPSCLTLPALGALCRSDFAIRIGGMQIDLLHPGVLALGVIGAVLAVFVFRNPA